MVWMSGVEPRPIRCQETSGLFWHNFKPEKKKAGNDDGSYKAMEVSRGAKLTIIKI